MTNYSLTPIGAGTVVAPAGTLIDLEQVQHESSRKEAQLMIMPMPTMDSNMTFSFDFMGVQRTITIDGVFTGKASDARTFITSIEAIANGGQSVGASCVYYTPAGPGDVAIATGKYGVQLNSFNWEFDVDAPNISDSTGAEMKIKYQLTLTECQP